MPALLAAADDKKDGGQEPRRVKSRTEGGSTDKKLKGVSDQGLRRFLLVMVKQLLKVAQGMRELGGCLFDTCLCPVDGAEALKMAEQTHNYAEAVKRDGKGHLHGAPYIWAFAGLLAGLRERGDAVGAQNAKGIVDMMEWLDAHGVEDKMEMIRMCRLDKTYDKDKKRITFVLRDERWRQTVIACCVQAGMERKQGKAPASFMERELQEYVVQLLEHQTLTGLHVGLMVNVSLRPLQAILLLCLSAAPPLL
ncbi:unnamed protein product [Prorocentrum cordatum]|uniref:Uncharacterized protein n=1 Tax=Prorocentrum cordatum TaxID=2364126 RepID=A0ABN9XYX6_9DINO|nr:unnamed protein product [Polarella glacialis]